MEGELHQCFSENTALYFVTGKLPPEERAARQTHLDRCETCQQLIIRSMHVLDASEPVMPGGGWWNTMFPRGLLVGDRYRIDRFIARGGMGEIYEAFDCMLGMSVAVKTVASTLSDDYEAIAQIKAEVQLALRVSHKNVCRIHGLGTHQPQTGPAVLFLTMELVEGITLGDKIHLQGKFSYGEAARLAAGILHGLQAAHDSGVLHRDLKSDNIMLRTSRSGIVSPVIMDFGLASALNPNSSRLSADHAMVGSLAYMAPEQVQGDDLRVATDLYAFGVILFEMVTGRLPFEAPTPAGSALKRLQEPAPHLNQTLPDVPQALDELVARCLERDPKRRFPSADAVLTALFASNLVEPVSADGIHNSDAPIPLTRPSVPPGPDRASPTRSSSTLGPPTLGSPTRIPSPTTLELSASMLGTLPEIPTVPPVRRDDGAHRGPSSHLVIGALSGLLAAALVALLLPQFRGQAAGPTTVSFTTPLSPAERGSARAAPVAEAQAIPAEPVATPATPGEASAMPETLTAVPRPTQASPKRLHPLGVGSPAHFGVPSAGAREQTQAPVASSEPAAGSPARATAPRVCPPGLRCPKPLLVESTPPAPASSIGASP